MRTDNQGVSPIKAHGALHSQPQQKAELLNDQFRSVLTMEDTTCPVPTPEGPSTSNITPLSITTVGIKKLLSSINIKKAAGPDQIPNTYLKETVNELAPALSSLFSQSLTTGQLPDDWLTSNVSPVFLRKGTETWLLIIALCP